MTTRLTRAEWDLINSALAWYEASPEMLEMSLGRSPTEAEERRHGELLARVRHKVWQRSGVADA